MGILDSIKKAISGGEPPEPKPEKKLPDSFYIDTIESERAQKDTFFRTSSYSPLEDRTNFTGLSYYPPNPAYRLKLPLNRADEPEELTIQTNTGEERPFIRLGTVTFEVEGQSGTLAVYQGVGQDDLFVPFRDATSGSETYGAGRYLEPMLLVGDQILLDFNLAYNPFCAYSEHYSCPLPPFENHLSIPIRAGEKNYS